MKLASTRIITDNVIRLIQFYRQITGITPTLYSEDYAEIETPAATLAIGSRRSMERYGGGAVEPAANRSAILEFRVENVDRERSRLEGIVTAFELEPTTQPWGNRSMLFRDPDGNLINFFAPQDGLPLKGES